MTHDSPRARGAGTYDTSRGAVRPIDTSRSRGTVSTGADSLAGRYRSASGSAGNVRGDATSVRELQRSASTVRGDTVRTPGTDSLASRYRSAPGSGVSLHADATPVRDLQRSAPPMRSDVVRSGGADRSAGGDSLASRYRSAAGSAVNVHGDAGSVRDVQRSAPSARSDVARNGGTDRSVGGDSLASRYRSSVGTAANAHAGTPDREMHRSASPGRSEAVRNAGGDAPASDLRAGPGSGVHADATPVRGVGQTATPVRGAGARPDTAVSAHRYPTAAVEGSGRNAHTNPRSTWGHSDGSCQHGWVSHGCGWAPYSHCWGYSYPYYGCWWPWSWGCWWGWGWGYYSGYPYYPYYAYEPWYGAGYQTCYTPIVWSGYSPVYETVYIYEDRPVATYPAPHRADSAPTSAAEREASLGDAQFREGRFKEAVESYRRALEHAPGDATLHLVLADALFAEGDYQQSAYLVGKALRLDPELAKSMTDKRTFYQDTKTFETQLASLRAYLAQKPYDAAAHLVLGYNLRFSGDQDGAKRAFARVLEINPGNEAATTFLAALSAPSSQPTSR